MKFEKTGSPNGFCIFCEDIRQEINNKQTYVGAFLGSDLNVLGTLPAGIGKFCISIAYRQRLTDAIEPLVFEVHMPGDDDDKPTAKAEASLEEAFAKLPPPASDIEDPFIGMGLGFEFNPLEIKQEGRIQVSVIKGGKRYRLGALQIISRQPLKEAAN
jgi:hypothetical protein